MDFTILLLHFIHIEAFQQFPCTISTSTTGIHEKITIKNNLI